MFNRSKKYLLLIAVNIIILATWYYISQNKAVNEDAYDTDYVNSIIDSQEKLKTTVDILQTQVNNLKAEIVESDDEISRIQAEAEQNLLAKTEVAKQQSLVCENNASAQIKRLEDELARQSSKTASETSCAQLERELAAAKATISELERELVDVNEQLAQSELARADSLLSQSNREPEIDSNELQRLRDRIETLTSNLSNPIAIEKNYLNARYCQKPRFEELICVTEFLVRPSFTKMPISELEVKIKDSTGSTVADGEFSSAQTQLYRISMGRGKELRAGTYTVEYNVDGQNLVSEIVELVQ